jgi:hypothetical protein
MKRLLALLIALLCACSSQDSTTSYSDLGWQNIGTLGQPLLRRTFDVAPASGQYDFNNATQLSQTGWTGPFLIGLSGWVTADDPSAGALTFAVNYDDPTSTTRNVAFGATTNLVLSDPTSFFSTDAVWLVRESGTSLWELDTGLAGSAGTSTVHYEIMLHPTDPSDWSFFSDQ